MTKMQVSVFAGLMLAATLAVADGGAIKGSVAYTAEMSWDYDRDDEIERVQYWIDMDVETEGDQVKGGVVRYLKNLDSGEKIYEWSNMQMTGDNTRAPAEVSALTVEGNTARITVGEVTYAFRDSDAYAEGEPRSFVADDGLTQTEFPIFAGAVTVQAR